MNKIVVILISIAFGACVSKPDSLDSEIEPSVISNSSEVKDDSLKILEFWLNSHSNSVVKIVLTLRSHSANLDCELSQYLVTESLNSTNNVNSTIEINDTGTITSLNELFNHMLAQGRKDGFIKYNPEGFCPDSPLPCIIYGSEHYYSRMHFDILSHIYENCQELSVLILDILGQLDPQAPKFSHWSGYISIRDLYIINLKSCIVPQSPEDTLWIPSMNLK